MAVFPSHWSTETTPVGQLGRVNEVYPFPSACSAPGPEAAEGDAGGDGVFAIDCACACT